MLKSIVSLSLNLYKDVGIENGIFDIRSMVRHTFNGGFMNSERRFT